LGAPVEFHCSLAEIRARFGAAGIQSYAPIYGRLGAITDDTQMTLFTAEGLIRASNRFGTRGICHPVTVVWHAYLRWLDTQGEVPVDSRTLSKIDGWLYDQKDLHARRGPGGTCLSALSSSRMGTIEKPINNSKGCGGVMRIAPGGLIANDPFRLGCEIAATTHGHPSGYLAAGFLARLIYGIVHNKDLQAAIGNAREELLRWPKHEECLAAVDNAIALARSADAISETVERLGEGWVAEEALAISLFCALKAKDFLGGVRLAVNHGGDSDSTGAITGNILGASWGKAAIPEEFLMPLELREVIEQLSSDLLQVVMPVEDESTPEPKGEAPSDNEGVICLGLPMDIPREFIERYPPW
jgi:ADP-ribosylglycohydrolase